jgi:hypothetical protein
LAGYPASRILIWPNIQPAGYPTNQKAGYPANQKAEYPANQNAGYPTNQKAGYPAGNSVRETGYRMSGLIFCSNLNVFQTEINK